MTLRRVALVAFGCLMLVAGGVLAQVRGWPPFFPHGTRVQMDAVATTTTTSTPTDLNIYGNFGYVGSSHTQYKDGEKNTGTANCLLYLPSGSGVVRSIWGASGLTTKWTSMNNMEMRIYIGAGTISDLAAPPAGNLVAQIPLGPLLGAVYNEACADSIFTSELLDYTHGQRANTGNALWWRIPVPFENGILIQLWNRNGTPAPQDTAFMAFTWCAYETGVSTSPFQKWRLKCASLMAHTTAGGDSEAVIANLTSGAGMAVGLWASLKQADVEGIPSSFFALEGNWRLYPDGGVARTWETSGGEDLFGVDPYYFQNSVMSTRDWGVTYQHSAGSVGTVEAYRLFQVDRLVWSNGTRFAFENACGDYVDPTTDPAFDISADFLYYAIPSPLVP